MRFGSGDCNGRVGWRGRRKEWVEMGDRGIEGGKGGMEEEDRRHGFGGRRER